MLYNPTFLYTFVFSISWLLKPAMYAYKYRLAFLSETNRWLSINYQTKKVCRHDSQFYYYSLSLSGEKRTGSLYCSCSFSISTFSSSAMDSYSG